MFDFFNYVEKLRITKHLQTVERELRSKEIVDSNKKQREIVLTYLNEYWKTGEFPKNTDFKKRTPYFKDKFGTLCAMAYIIQRSGRSDIVDEIYTTNNNVYINDVHEGSLIEWLKTSGITKDEAARIQPSYEPLHRLYNIATFVYGFSIFALLEIGLYFLVQKWKIAGTKKFLAYVSLSTLNIILTIFLTYFLLLSISFLFTGHFPDRVLDY